MRINDSDNSLLARLRRFWAALARQREFTCGDCERSNRCGLPPDEMCVAKAEHLARGDWKLRRRYQALARTVGPI